MDELENHPHFYQRRQETVEVIENDNEEKYLNCWMYFLPRFKQQVLELKSYENYDAYGSHGLRYVERYRRQNLVKQGYSACSDIAGE